MERAIKKLLLLFCISLILSSVALADGVYYFYDDAGRLIRAAKGSEGLTYRYDEVGNLLSISKGTIGTGSPVLQSIQPNVFFIGQTIPIIITGQNLFTTKAVTSNNQSVVLKDIEVTDSEIKALVDVASNAIPGSVTITVTTLYGSANIQATLTLSKLTFAPGRLSIMPGDSRSITATIFPSLTSNVTISMRNSNPAVASSPQSVMIPAGGIANFTVNALSEGLAVIAAGDPKTFVFVNTFSVPVGETVTQKAGPVSVSIETSTTANSTMWALPVSVLVETSATANSTMWALPVSVLIETSFSQNTITSSFPVSVMKETPIADSIVVSLPVSAQISPP